MALAPFGMQNAGNGSAEDPVTKARTGEGSLHVAAVDRREAAHWDEHADRLPSETLHTERVARDNLVRCTLALLGGIQGRRILDVGCGTGQWSVFLAEEGAEVFAIDLSSRSVRVTQRRAEVTGVRARVHTAVMSATGLGFRDGFFDAVFGRDIIHHIPDTVAFGREVARVLRPDGRAVFEENCANNRALMLARDYLCGRFGIPKWSSDDEYPLTRARLARFAGAFEDAQVEYPQFLFFFYFDAKLFGYRNRLVSWLCRHADDGIHRFFPPLRQYSYRQVIACRRPRRA